MEFRVKFPLGQQKDFLRRAQETSKLHPDQLAKIAGVVPRSFRDWKREKLCMSLKAAKLFLKRYNLCLNEDLKMMVLRWREHKSEVAKRGGLACFKKYGSPATQEGRKRGGAKTLALLRERGIIPAVKTYLFPKKLSNELAEYVGILLGDGGITTSQVCVTLNGEADKDYVDFVRGLELRLFGVKPKLLKRKDSKAVSIYLNGVFLVKYLTKVGLKIGNKVKQQVDVPIWIKTSEQFRLACLRGLMDTDGGVFLHRYKVNGKMYIYKKICFSNRSLPLLNFVYQILEKLGLTPKLITKVENKKVWLYNKHEVERYLDLVGTHNSRLLKYQS